MPGDSSDDEQKSKHVRDLEELLFFLARPYCAQEVFQLTAPLQDPFISGALQILRLRVDKNAFGHVLRKLPPPPVQPLSKNLEERVAALEKRASSHSLPSFQLAPPHPFFQPAQDVPRGFSFSGASPPSDLAPDTAFG